LIWREKVVVQETFAFAYFQGDGKDPSSKHFF
jgi:hypothetical protein